MSFQLWVAYGNGFGRQADDAAAAHMHDVVLPQSFVGVAVGKAPFPLSVNETKLVVLTSDLRACSEY